MKENLILKNKLKLARVEKDFSQDEKELILHRRPELEKYF